MQPVRIGKNLGLSLSLFQYLGSKNRPGKVPAEDHLERETETGQITVLMSGVVIGILCLLLGCLGLGTVSVAKAQAQNGADFAALGTAKAHFYRTNPNPCQLASQIAAKNKVQLVQCTIGQSQVQIQVKKPVWGLGQLWPVTATAQAGPRWE